MPVELVGVLERGVDVEAEVDEAFGAPGGDAGVLVVVDERGVVAW